MGQDATTTDARLGARIAAVAMLDEQELRWGENGLPQLPDRAFLLGTFTRDGKHLVVQVGLCHFAIDPATRTCKQLGNLTGWNLAGPVGDDRVQLSRDGGMAVASVPDGELDVRTEPQAIQQAPGMIRITAASRRSWWLTPDERTAIASAPFEIHELIADRQTALPGLPETGWCSWSQTAERFAVGTNGGKQPTMLHVFDRAGAAVAAFAAPSLASVEFDLDGKHVWWTGDGLHRGNLRTGEVAHARTAARWFWQLDPQLGLGFDGKRFQVWDLAGMTPERDLLQLPAPVDVDAVPVGPPRPRSTSAAFGQVGVGLATASPQRDRLAVATPTGLRWWRLTR